MIYNKKFYLFFSLFFLLANLSKAQSGYSNIGTEFWVAYMDHYSGATGINGSSMSLYITSDLPTSGVITVADGSFTGKFSTTSNQITTFNIPASAFLGNSNGITSKGIHVVSQSPISIYAHIYASNISGATLLLPVNTLSNDYYSLNYTQISNTPPSYSAFTVIATEDATTIEITPTALLIDGSLAFKSFVIQLNKGQVYQGLSDNDLTGSRIRSISTSTSSCKKISVFSGSSKILIGKPNYTSDNLFQQVYPTAAWGRNYISVPLKNRNYDTFRIAISDLNTTVQVNGNVLAKSSLINQFYYEFNSQQANYITADKPIQVIQYSVTQGNSINGQNIASDVGDPEMIFLNPIEQNIDNVILYSTQKYQITNSYVNITIPTNAVSSFLIDGVSQTGFKTLNSNPLFSYGQFNLQTNATHRLSANQGFNAIAYGFGDRESYGYSAGTNLKNLNEYIQFRDPLDNKIVSSGCAGVPVIPQITIPFATTSITWDLGDGNPPVLQNNPHLISTQQKDNQTLYTYDYGLSIAYTTGAYPIKVTVFSPIGTQCGSNEELNLNFNVGNAPTAKFSSRDSICVLDTISFKDVSLGNGTNIRSWKWDFNNGDTSKIQNPVYQYSTPGDYNVSLLVVNNGCQDVYTKRIHVRQPPNVAFSYSTPDCENQNVTFTDKSIANEGHIVTWNWDFGDGTSGSNQQNPTHKFTSAKNYIVTLTLTTDKGCTGGSKSIPIVIDPLPVSDFPLPETCVNDSYASFNAIQDSRIISYQWTFANTLSDLSTSNATTATGANVTHNVNQVGSYYAKLTTTNINGCSNDLVKQYFVNGSSSVANFDVIDATNLCSDRPVQFVNRSSIPGGFNNGDVTAVDVFYDYINQPTVFTHYDRPVSGQLFSHQYTTENFSPKNYMVRMIAYSGQSCHSTPFDFPITLLPVPLINTNNISDICQNAGFLDLQHYFSVAGAPSVTAFYLDESKIPLLNSMFDPTTTTIGHHTVTFIATAKNGGCIETASQSFMIAPVPTVSAGPDLDLVAGESITLQGQASKGYDLKYLWTPSTDLSDPTNLNPLASPKNDTKYTLTVTQTTSGISCPISSSVNVKILHLPIIPNTFTPNGDGINDTWEIKYLDKYPDCNVRVFNRMGELVYSSTGYPIAWDGHYRNTALPTGTYYYIIDPKHNLKTMSGSVNIIK